ncbi:MAG: helix-turn-helix transcriptional regulator [Treponema sp.]|nr:helix-turn-helix transcriptional regulator [Treponema sp.]
MDINEQLQYVINKIKEIRIKNGISQMELSLRSNLSQSFIANLEKGKKQPSVLTLIKIANALNIKTNELFTVDPTPQNELEKIRQDIIFEVVNAVKQSFAEESMKIKNP